MSHYRQDSVLNESFHHLLPPLTLIPRWGPCKCAVKKCPRPESKLDIATYLPYHF